jgi:hypothetical protein
MLGWLKKLFGGSSSPPDPGSGGMYSVFRDQALALQRSSVGIPVPPSDVAIWGMLMETGYGNATATLFALMDGTTSLYLSSGGGVIGGQAHDSVRAANAAFLSVANQMSHYLVATNAFPLPETGGVIFYGLTDSGVVTGSAPEDDLGHGRHPLSPLFHAGYGVLTELRRFSGG